MNLVLLREVRWYYGVSDTTNFSTIPQTRKVADPADKKKGSEVPSTKEILNADGVLMVLIIFVFILGMALAYAALVPVFLFTEVPLGGFGLSPREIAYLLGAAGAGRAVWTLTFPYLHKRIGSKGILTWASYAYPAIFAVLSAVNFALRRRLPPIAFWIMTGLVTFFGAAIPMSFTAIQLTINDISPSPGALGTLNGIGTVILLCVTHIIETNH